MGWVSARSVLGSAVPATEEGTKFVGRQGVCGLWPPEFEILTGPQIDLCKTSLGIQDGTVLYIAVGSPFRNT